jgi:NADH:ubiquinone oxidoreductase subunit F (NADH-binding)/(2Fe-2S) ferredoxin
MSECIRNSDDLAKAASAGAATLYPDQLKIVVGAGTCGLSVGAGEIEKAATEAVKELGLEATVIRTGCIGFCGREPLLDLVLPGGPRVSYGNMTAEKTRELLAAYAESKGLKPELILGRFEKEDYILTGEVHEYGPAPDELKDVAEWSDLDFYRRQKKVIMRNCGSIDPLSIDESIARGTYQAVQKALESMSADDVLAEVESSGLSGRGGASFPTGRKWRFARQAEGDIKYLVCNADEGAPGSYMDRSVLEGDPHAIIEGMILGSFAIGAAEGFIYVRSEYPLAISTLEKALADAEERGLLGDDIMGSGWSLRLSVRRGSGAYVCGEETALIESIEGHSGEPRGRPPFPVVAGLWQKPTVVNNVKTWASVAPIITRGSDWYKSMGTETSHGTTIFSLEGTVKNPGLVEVPYGISLGDMINEVGGGTLDDKPIKAIQAGGPSKGCISPDKMDMLIEAAPAPGKPAMVGTGSIIVLDEETCVVDMTRFLLGFFNDESCGKCTSCREGTKQMLGLLTDICEGRGTDHTLAQLKRLSSAMKAASVCGLGSMAPDPVLTGLECFPQEFAEHVHDRKCSAGICEMGEV